MQIVVNVMFVVMIVIAVFYWYKYERECDHSYELEDKLCEINCNKIKERNQMVIISDEICRYKKGGNPYTALAKISDVISKKEISAD